MPALLVGSHLPSRERHLREYPANAPPPADLAAQAPGGIRPIPLYWVIPGLALAVALHYVAVAAGGWYAFTDWNGHRRDANWIGLENFREIFRDQPARGALMHTLELAALFVVVGERDRPRARARRCTGRVKSRNVLRSLFFAPVVLSPLAIVVHLAVHLRLQRRRSTGLLGASASTPGSRRGSAIPTGALDDPRRAWSGSSPGSRWCIYLAGLQGIPDELHEAAAVDGASRWLRLRAVDAAAARARDDRQRRRSR